MRFDVVLLACLGMAPFATPVLANPANSPQPAASTSSPPAATSTSVPAPASSATAASSSTPASSSAPAAPAASANATAALDAEEKQMISMGYKPQMHHGQKVYCKREPVMGSRVETTESCKTLEELRALTQMSRQYTENSQRMSSPTGH